MTGALERLAELARQEAERSGLEAQVVVAREQLATATQRRDEAATRLASELDDVSALESMSMTRILAGLRGSRDLDLNREQAEADAARYAAAEAEARRVVAERELDDLWRRIAGLDDLPARRTTLLAEREREIAADPSSGPLSARLTELAERQGRLQAEVAELEEALAAAERAGVALMTAQQHIGGASGWATYDTLFGGGMVSDLAKYSRLDRAAVLMREADAALAHLAAELADVGVRQVGELGITQLARAFDVWFDNIFSDWAVRERIRQAAERVHQLLTGLAATSQELRTRRDATQAALDALAAEREGLLTGLSAGSGS